VSARSEAATDSLIAHHVLEFPGGYKRSVGPVVGRFLTGLRDRRIVGVRRPDGRVLVPPTEYDPETSEALGGDPSDFVEVGPAGVVTTWGWVAAPRAKHPLGHPFAWALIRLDGADTPMLHAVDAGSEDAMATGLRVRPRWRAETVGHISDIEAFQPEGGEPEVGEPEGGERGEHVAGDGEQVTIMAAPIRIDLDVGAGTAQSKFLRGLMAGKIRGQRCPVCTKVYLPPRGSCPTDGVPTEEEVELPDTGTVTTFCVVNIAFSELAPEVPYVCAQVLVDGADTALFGLVAGLPAADCRMGLRVRAVWQPPDERRPSTECIKWFEPTGEADAPYDAYKAYL